MKNREIDEISYEEAKNQIIHGDYDHRQRITFDGFANFRQAMSDGLTSLSHHDIEKSIRHTFRNVTK